jgi:hypothetical protein
MSLPASLTDFYPPGQATIFQNHDTVYKGGSITFTCRLEDHGRPPAKQFVWTRGHQIVNGQTAQNWTINPVTLSTQTNISCHAVNAAGEGIRIWKEIIVLAQPSFVQNLAPHTRYSATSKQIQLSCQVECSPPCHIGWYRNGSCKNTSQLYTIVTHRIQQDLPANQAESTGFNLDSWPFGTLDHKHDNTEYSCQSTSNCEGPKSSNCKPVKSQTHFIVEFPPENIQISDKIIQVVENETPGKILCAADVFLGSLTAWDS